MLLRTWSLVKSRNLYVLTVFPSMHNAWEISFRLIPLTIRLRTCTSRFERVGFNGGGWSHSLVGDALITDLTARTNSFG